MIAPLIAMLVIGFLSAIWPGPKMDHEPPKSGGIFAPHVKPDATILVRNK